MVEPTVAPAVLSHPPFPPSTIFTEADVEEEDEEDNEEEDEEHPEENVQHQK